MTRLIFEPHNGYGGNDPDGDPWPFGYISERPGCPLFELNVVMAEPVGKLAYFAKLFAAAPDHALIGWAMCVAAGRWNPWGDGRGEFCINGFCHATQLDEFGVPEMTDAMRRALQKAKGSPS